MSHSSSMKYLLLLFTLWSWGNRGTDWVICPMSEKTRRCRGELGLLVSTVAFVLLALCGTTLLLKVGRKWHGDTRKESFHLLLLARKFQEGNAVKVAFDPGYCVTGWSSPKPHTVRMLHSGEDTLYPALRGSSQLPWAPWFWCTWNTESSGQRIRGKSRKKY